MFPVKDTDRVLPFKVAAAGEIHQLFRPAVTLAALLRIVVAKAVGGNMLDIGLQLCGIAQIPVGRGDYDGVCTLELPGCGKHLPVKLSGQGKGVPPGQKFGRQGRKVQFSNIHPLHLPVRVGGAKGIDIGFCQCQRAGILPPLADAAVNKQQLHSFSLHARLNIFSSSYFVSFTATGRPWGQYLTSPFCTFSTSTFNSAGSDFHPPLMAALQAMVW